MVLNLSLKLMVFLAVFFLLPPQRTPGELKIITIMTESWKDCTNPDGTGLYFDMIRLVYPEYKIKFRIAPYKRSMHYCRIGKVDMSIGAYKDEVDDVIYPKIHFFNDETSAVYLKSTPFRGIESLKGANVIWLRGYSYDKYIDQPMKFFEQDSQSKALKLLKHGVFKFYIGPRVMLEDSLDRKIFGISSIKWIRMYMVFAVNNKGWALSGMWDRNFKELIKKGVIKDLFKKYGMLKSYRFKE